MATPAARPIQKRYTAGSCTLEVSFKPSALSQWHPKPIATDLAFKLWLQMVQQYAEQTNAQTGVAAASSDGVVLPTDVSPTLVAEGDRTQLQAIAQHLQQQTRQTLATPALAAQSGLPGVLPQSLPQNSTARPPQLPPGCLIEGPLTYLQLCDLTSVLGQYEQATQTLPVALPAALPAPLSATQSTQLPATSATTGEASRSIQTLITAKNETPSKNKASKDNLVPFPTGRRRPSRKLWASSAAAAIFAVGLTTTLWQTQRQFSPQAEITAESADGSASPSQITATRPNAATPTGNERNSATGREKPGGLGNLSLPSSLDSAGVDSSDTANRRRIPPASSTAAAGSSSSPAELADPLVTAQQPPNPSVAATPPNVVPDAVEVSPTPPPSPAPTAAPERSTDPTGPLASIPRSAAPSSIESLTLRRGPGAVGSATSETTDEALAEAALPPQSSAGDELASSDAAAGSIAADEPSPSDAAESIAEDSPVDDAEISAGDLPPQPSQTAAQSPSPPLTARRQAPQPSVETFSQAPMEGEASSAGNDTAPTLSVGERATIAKVTDYFQSRWQANQQRSGVLSYRLQLSENAEVVSFAAINDEAEAYRDRLIPGDRTLSFSDSESSTDAQTAPLTLRITLMPNGQVLVSKF